MINQHGRAGAVRKAGSKKGATVGSGGNVRKSLEGKKATPKAKDRVHHKAYAAAKHAAKVKEASLARKKTSTTEYVLGRNPVVECLQAKIPASALYIMQGAQNDERLTLAIQLAANKGIPIMEVLRPELDRLVDNVQHQGVALQVPPYQYQDPGKILYNCLEHIKQGRFPVVIALDNVTDPRNLGAIVRSAAAFGAQGVIIPARRSAEITAVSWRTSAGTAAHMSIAKATNLTRTLQEFASHGFQIIGLDIVNAISLDDYAADSPIVIVVGSEGKGLSRLVKENCDAIITIPMHPQAESLNASVAASIVMAEFARQHRKGKSI